MIPQQIIARKRDGGELEPDVLESFLDGYMDGRVGEEQMAAFLMAVYFRGLGAAELRCLTRTMLDSGEVLDFGHLPGPCVDKHSTGGVGDKVSLVLAPLAADMGMVVPMMSGRGLGHTGGTLDKLESIDGFETRLTLERFRKVVESVGFGMIGQTDRIAPLDRRLYALRDITGTVSSIDLIAASIMSKKLAEGLGALVLDVKVGSGAFLPELDDAVRLARTMVALGDEHGLAVTAVLTAMDRPLGRAVGNGVEVKEALACLRGGGPPGLREISLRLAAEMAVATGLAPGVEVGTAAATKALESGGPMARFDRMVRAQGGRGGLETDDSGVATAPVIRPVEASVSGYVQAVDPRAFGYGLISLGGGRTRADQSVDPRVGFEILVSPGDGVTPGQPLALAHLADESQWPVAAGVVEAAIPVGEGAPAAQLLPLVVDRIVRDDVGND